VRFEMAQVPSTRCILPPSATFDFRRIQSERQVTPVGMTDEKRRDGKSKFKEPTEKTTRPLL
jgi:hypothetical protein